MNTASILTNVVFLVAILTVTTGCDDSVTDFGFDASISGIVTDPSGNIVSGDVTSRDLTVFALGEHDNQPIEIRVKGDGTYTNTHLYPQSYSLWIEGPVISTEEVTVDLEGGAGTHDFTVTPFLTLSAPEIVGNPSSNEVDISYSITENEGHVAEERVIYASTSSWPSEATGSGATWHTVVTPLEDNQGSVTVTGLEADTRYFIRVAARAAETDDWNLSDQTVITTP